MSNVYSAFNLFPQPLKPSPIVTMDISKTIAELKKRPDFNDNVGMILIHNGTVRNWSRRDRQHVTALETTVDQEKILRLRQEYLEWPGIYDIIIEARSGYFVPGDDLLFILVAGDIRENIKPVLAELLDRIKSEAISKKEITG
jgi:molybdopterin synthase catalytic subunit